MTSGRTVVGTFGDLVRTDGFLAWLEKRFPVILIREDYWYPGILSLPSVRVVPETALDRHEILLLPKGLGATCPVSVSWNMLLTLLQGEGSLTVHMMRGAANCATCAGAKGRGVNGIRCETLGMPMRTATLACRDLGMCPEFARRTGPLRTHHLPVWWKDSDWPVAAWRYHPYAFDTGRIAKLITRWEDSHLPLRLPAIPLAPYERAKLEAAERGGPPWRRAATPTKAGWLAWMRAYVLRSGVVEKIEVSEAQLDVWLEEIALRDFDAAGTIRKESETP